MRGLAWLLVVFAAAIALALFGRLDNGYVLLVYPPWRIEFSLLFFAIATLAVFAALHLALALARRIFAIPAQVRDYRERRQRNRAQLALASALQAYFEGRYARAEKDAERAQAAGAVPGLAALIGARAAHQLRDFARRDRWLEQVRGPELDLARGITRAELALEERDFRAARDTLRALRDTGPKHVATLRMLLRAERGTGDWEEVLALAAQLLKRDAISPAIADEYRLQAIVELLGRDAVERKRFQERWKSVPAAEQAHPRVAGVAASHATALGLAPLAREILERSLAREWTTALVVRYGELPGPKSDERTLEARTRIERAEKWLRARPEDPQLLATLGRLCAGAELWGKAQSYLETSLAFEDSRTAHLELARLALQLGREADAQTHFRHAAELQ